MLVEGPPPYYPGHAQSHQGYESPQQPGAVYNQPLYPMGQQCQEEAVPVTIEYVYMTEENSVDDFLGYSIFTMLFCCLPLGIAACVYSLLVRQANRLGDRMSAERNSRTARTLNHVALGLGIALWVILISLLISFFVIISSL
ncbi:synapse differentiation-inducing gene protein 1-like isoform X2 [Fundulus heteroclitus]|uniref:synapse differentiation-inducing gene protein 1-like isoform X2 n=1 Tax=Fundulus heteroclitus TaxID=8078 RepID=UPI00165BA7EA|nr:synapse differentiation-inducing gene protein 1-like isoform X2 [Fundulus heteroclitus]